MPDTFIATEGGECEVCLYDFQPGEEVGHFNGELLCAGCHERAVDAA